MHDCSFNEGHQQCALNSVIDYAVHHFTAFEHTQDANKLPHQRLRHVVLNRMQFCSNIKMADGMPSKGTNMAHLGASPGFSNTPTSAATRG